uniref:Aminotransferase class I/classII domain-containing protein n=1 Tax=Parascaris equorum TaxID=6256 RepID=A0A914S2Y1_PAREQ
MGRIDIINSTLGKALGGAMGGYTTGPKPFIDLLRQRSRPYLFSNSLAPSIVGASLKICLTSIIEQFLQVLDLLMQPNEFTSSLKSNITHFRESLKNAGFDVLGNPDHPICPVMLGDARLAANFADEMLKEGIYVIGFSYPVVPRGKARIRVQ